ncbi:MAG TPA: hypothetical protein DEA47_04470 [Peptococcaceae bacterium]|nr:hypothetical protein [Peptococcaceae bacterium]
MTLCPKNPMLVMQYAGFCKGRNRIKWLCLTAISQNTVVSKVDLVLLFFLLTSVSFANCLSFKFLSRGYVNFASKLDSI